MKFGFIVSMYEKDSGIPVRTEEVETYLEATEVKYKFQDLAFGTEYGVIITEGYFTTSQGASGIEAN